MKSTQQSHRHTVRAGLCKFRRVYFLFYATLVLTTDKATVRFRSGTKWHTKHYSLQPHSLIFAPHKLFRRTHIYRHWSLVNAIILKVTAHARKHLCVTGTSVYSEYMTVAGSIDSRKSYDRLISDKVPQMLLATTKVPQMQIFFFYTGNI
jgi:hypothetical protein